MSIPIITPLLVWTNGQKSTLELETFFPEVSQQINKTHRLVEDLLYWPKAQIDGVGLNRKEIDFLEVFEDVNDLFSSGLKAKNLVLNKDIPSSLSLYADEDMIKFILRNLVSNAIKFSHANGASMDMSAYEKKAMVKIHCKDHGIGMTQEVQKELFSTKTRSKLGTEGALGTGLGLSLVKEFVERHQGTISVDSTLGEGSDICISLPLYQP